MTPYLFSACFPFRRWNLCGSFRFRFDFSICQVLFPFFPVYSASLLVLRSATLWLYAVRPNVPPLLPASATCAPIQIHLVCRLRVQRKENCGVIIIGVNIKLNLFSNLPLSLQRSRKRISELTRCSCS